MNSKITILLATHNRSHLIGETLESIMAQTYKNWECLIVDDHSTDGTFEVIKQCQKKDPRFFYFSKTTNYSKGLSGTRNQGLDIAKKRGAEYIQFFDDDDIMHPQKLELQIQPFIKNSKLDLSICCYRKFHNNSDIEFDLEMANDQSCIIRTDYLLKSFYLNEINLNSLGPLWKAEIFKKYRFNEKLFYAEERELFLRIFLNERIEFYPVYKVLFWYRKHDLAITSDFYTNSCQKNDSFKLHYALFFNEVLKQKQAPTFLLKSFIGRASKQKDIVSLVRIKDYLHQNNRWLDFQNLLLLLYIHLIKLFKV